MRLSSLALSLAVLLGGAGLVNSCALSLAPDEGTPRDNPSDDGGSGGTINSGRSGSGPTGGQGGLSVIPNPPNAGAGNNGGTTSGGGSGLGGALPTMNECLQNDDCPPVDGNCVICQVNLLTQFFQCVDTGPTLCNGDELDPCEVCDGAELGTATCATIPPAAGEPAFNSGTLGCNDTCDGYDTSNCSVCGNDVADGVEECDGADEPVTTCADLGLMPPTGGTDVQLECDDARCMFDSLPCPKCADDIADADCLRDGATDCVGAACLGKQCGTTETCDLDCSSFQQVCTDVSCNAGSTCDLDCGGQGNCTLDCLAGARCSMACGEFQTTCAGTCGAGAVCEFTCSQSGSCDVACEAGSACSLDCSIFGNTCTGTAACSSGETCNYVCGQSSDCSGLTVTCEAGSTCNVDCNSQESVCPVVTCEAGSTCTFTCGDANGSSDCNGPTCEDPADCTCSVAGVDCGF